MSHEQPKPRPYEIDYPLLNKPPYRDSYKKYAADVGKDGALDTHILLDMCTKRIIDIATNPDGDATLAFKAPEAIGTLEVAQAVGVDYDPQDPTSLSSLDIILGALNPKMLEACLTKATEILRRDMEPGPLRSASMNRS